MTTRFYFQNLKESDKRLLEDYFAEKKAGRLEKLLQHGNFELAKLVVNAKYRQRHNAFTIKIGLNFAKTNLRSEEVGHNSLLEVFDLAFDRTIGQLRKSESRLHDK